MSTMQTAILRIIGGPEAGRDIELTTESLTVGRGSKADATVNDRLLSRVHARFFQALDGWYVEDLRSTNGTWLGGQSVKVSTRLETGDHVRIGKTLLELIPADVTSHQEDQFDPSRISYRLDPHSVESLTIATDGPALKMQREQDKLAAIYQVQGLFRQNLEDQDLYSRILSTITQILPCEVAYLLLYNRDDGSVEPACCETTHPDAEENPSSYISRSIVNYVQEQQHAVLSSDATDEEGINQTYVSGMRMTTIMCSPMLSGDELYGMIYLMSMQGQQVFIQDDLKLLSAIAQSAAMAIENSRLVARNMQQERLAAIGMTAAGLSHYVKNILTGLEGSISLLRLGIDNDNHDTMDAAWNILSTNHRRLSSLMLDLLSLSKELKLYFDLHNVADILTEVTELIQSQVSDDNIRLELNPIVREVKLMAKVDNKGIHRVVLNLLNNAVDSVRQRHGDSGDGLIKIDAMLENEGETLVLEVEDNGLGIPKEELNKIFDSFHSSKGERGTGLGLAVTRRIVEGHKGRIFVDSQINERTIFTVRIPTQQNNANTQYVKRSSILDRRLLPD